MLCDHDPLQLKVLFQNGGNFSKCLLPRQCQGKKVIQDCERPAFYDAEKYRALSAVWYVVRFELEFYLFKVVFDCLALRLEFLERTERSSCHDSTILFASCDIGGSR